MTTETFNSKIEFFDFNRVKNVYDFKQYKFDVLIIELSNTRKKFCHWYQLVDLLFY